MTQITIALTKGRILKETLPLLARAGIVPAEDVFTSRKLVFPTNRDNVRLIILRGSDVTTYVQFGAADLGVAGKDMLLEHQGDGYYEPLDLGIARCKLMTAVPVGTTQQHSRLRPRILPRPRQRARRQPWPLSACPSAKAPFDDAVALRHGSAIEA